MIYISIESPGSCIFAIMYTNTNLQFIVLEQYGTKTLHSMKTNSLFELENHVLVFHPFRHGLMRP